MYQSLAKKFLFVKKLGNNDFSVLVQFIEVSEWMMTNNKLSQEVLICPKNMCLNKQIINFQWEIVFGNFQIGNQKINHCVRMQKLASSAPTAKASVLHTVSQSELYVNTVHRGAFCQFAFRTRAAHSTRMTSLYAFSSQRELSNKMNNSLSRLFQLPSDQDL